MEVPFWFYFSEAIVSERFLNGRSPVPPSSLLKVEKAEKGQGETEWKGGGGGELLRCWKTPHDAVESSTVRNSHPRTPLSVTATALLLRAPRSHTHTHIYCIHTYIGVCVCVYISFLPFRIHKHTTSDWPPLILFLFRSYSSYSSLCSFSLPTA
jgi:hypothetical protein